MKEHPSKDAQNFFADKNNRWNRFGFTLIELLVVVLIIGILAAIAVPQYQKAVEKARMTEAVSFVRTIANANLVFYMKNGTYADTGELDLLDIDVPGTGADWGGTRIKTTHFMYSPRGLSGNELALAHRLNNSGATGHGIYYIYISRSDPLRIRCAAYENGEATAIQRKLCQRLNATGTL